MTKLRPEIFPWRGADVALCSAAVALTYFSLLFWAPFGGLESGTDVLRRTGILAAAFVLPPVLVALLRTRAVRTGEEAALLPLGVWAPRAALSRDVTAGLVLGMLLAVMTGISIKLQLGDPLPGPSDGLSEITWHSHGLGDVAAILVALGFVAPVAEEVFFRGFLYTALRKAVPVVPALVLSAGAFGAAHFDSMRVHAFLLGLVAAILVEFTGSLVPAVLAHAGVNIGFVLFWANGGVLAEAVSTGVLVALFAALNLLFFLLGQPLFAERPPEGDAGRQAEDAEADGS